LSALLLRLLLILIVLPEQPLLFNKDHLLFFAKGLYGYRCLSQLPLKGKTRSPRQVMRQFITIKVTSLRHEKICFPLDSGGSCVSCHMFGYESQQFFLLERFLHIGIRSILEPGVLFKGFIIEDRRHQNNGDLPGFLIPLQGLADDKAIGFRHLNIEEDNIRHEFTGHLEAVLSIDGNFDIQTCLGEKISGEVPNIGRVIHDKSFGHGPVPFRFNLREGDRIIFRIMLDRDARDAPPHDFGDHLQQFNSGKRL